jgi:CheY-like chemotaxis protein
MSEKPIPDQTNQKKTILVVDDNLPFRLLMRAFLQKADYNVYEAEHGEQALALIKTSAVDLILLDLQMLPIGGFDFMTQYIQDGHTTPVILITADPSGDILTRASKLGLAGVIKKPVTEERLIPLVQRLLSA